MAQYINKADVVAKIEERINRNNEEAASYSSSSEHDHLCRVKEAVYKNLLDLFNTLEVKEVDLVEEYKNFVEDDPVYNKLINNIVGKAIAKHFFELGLNTKKEE